jgi:hypothetical protein
MLLAGAILPPPTGAISLEGGGGVGAGAGVVLHPVKIPKSNIATKAEINTRMICLVILKLS